MFFSTQAGKVSSNPGRVQFEGLVQLLKFIRYKNNLVSIYYAKIEDKNISELLRQDIIKT